MDPLKPTHAEIIPRFKGLFTNRKIPLIFMPKYLGDYFMSQCCKDKDTVKIR